MPIVVLGETLYSLKETAEMLGVTPRTMHHYLQKGLIRGRKVRNMWRFTEAEIREYLEPEPPAGQKAAKPGA
jgi:excisionase family DNA binding protein